MCSAEEVIAEDATHPFAADQQDDDCFCCCSHTERTAVVTIRSEGISVIVDRVLDERLAPGVAHELYHPPLHS